MINCHRSHTKNSGCHDICWPPPALGISATHRAIRGSLSGGSATIAPWPWNIGSHSRMNDNNMDLYPNCLSLVFLHFVNFRLIFMVIVLAQSNSFKFIHSNAKRSCVLVASCSFCDPTARVMVWSTTLSARSRTVWMSTFLLPDHVCAPGHTLSITIDIFSPEGLVPIKIATGPLRDNPIMK